jgi:phage baseplate assembly protein W
MGGGPAVPERERRLARRRLLGWSVACEQIAPGVDLGRDVRLANGDLVQVTEIDALGQSLQLALTTLLGSDAFNTEFGFDGLNALAEETNPILARERIRVAVITVLRREPRVSRILDVKLSDGRLDRLRGAARDLDVRVSFETVTGDAETVTLGKVVPNA